MLLVALLPSIFFPPKRPTDGRTVGQSDSIGAAVQPPATPAPQAMPPRQEPTVSPAVRPSDTVWVSSPLYRLGFSTRGGHLVWAELLEYRSFAAGDSAQRVQHVPVGTSPASLTLTGERRGARVTLTYTFAPDDYRFEVRGTVTGLGPAGAVLVLGMGEGLRSLEADSLDDYRHYA